MDSEWRLTIGEWLSQQQNGKGGVEACSLTEGFNSRHP
jgi:hypothetical protein